MSDFEEIKFNDLGNSNKDSNKKGHKDTDINEILNRYSIFKDEKVKIKKREARGTEIEVLLRNNILTSPVIELIENLIFKIKSIELTDRTKVITLSILSIFSIILVVLICGLLSYTDYSKQIKNDLNNFEKEVNSFEKLSKLLLDTNINEFKRLHIKNQEIIIKYRHSINSFKKISLKTVNKHQLLTEINKLYIDCKSEIEFLNKILNGYTKTLNIVKTKQDNIKEKINEIEYVLDQLVTYKSIISIKVNDIIYKHRNIYEKNDTKYIEDLLGNIDILIKKTQDDLINLNYRPTMYKEYIKDIDTEYLNFISFYTSVKKESELNNFKLLLENKLRIVNQFIVNINKDISEIDLIIKVVNITDANFLAEYNEFIVNYNKESIFTRDMILKLIEQKTIQDIKQIENGIAILDKMKSMVLLIKKQYKSTYFDYQKQKVSEQKLINIKVILEKASNYSVRLSINKNKLFDIKNKFVYIISKDKNIIESINNFDSQIDSIDKIISEKIEEVERNILLTKIDKALELVTELEAFLKQIISKEIDSQTDNLIIGIEQYILKETKEKLCQYKLEIDIISKQVFNINELINVLETITTIKNDKLYNKIKLVLNLKNSIKELLLDIDSINNSVVGSFEKLNEKLIIIDRNFNSIIEDRTNVNEITYLLKQEINKYSNLAELEKQKDTCFTLLDSINLQIIRLKKLLNSINASITNFNIQYKDNKFKKLSEQILIDYSELKKKSIQFELEIEDILYQFKIYNYDTCNKLANDFSVKIKNTIDESLYILSKIAEIIGYNESLEINNYDTIQIGSWYTIIVNMFKGYEEWKNIVFNKCHSSRILYSIDIKKKILLNEFPKNVQILRTLVQEIKQCNIDLITKLNEELNLALTLRKKEEIEESLLFLNNNEIIIEIGETVSTYNSIYSMCINNNFDKTILEKLDKQLEQIIKNFEEIHRKIYSTLLNIKENS